MMLRAILAGPAYGVHCLYRAVAGGKEPPGSFRVLLMHGVPPEDAGALDRLLGFANRKFGFLTPAEAAARLDGMATEDRRPAPCLLSFDDGFASNHDVVRPILARHGIKALFFVCPGLVDLDGAAQERAVREAMFRDGVPCTVEPLMRWDRIAALQDDGHVIGAHSMGHRCLAGMDADSQAAAVGPDADRIAAETGLRPDWFAFPFGDIDSVDETALGVISRHYRYCRSGVRGLNRTGTDALGVYADHVDLRAPAAWQKLAVAGGLWGRYAAPRARLAAMAAAAHNAAP